MPEIICADCGKRMFHENSDTLKIEETIHKKFCRKNVNEVHSYMHRDDQHMQTFDSERESDMEDKPILKK